MAHNEKLEKLINLLEQIDKSDLEDSDNTYLKSEIKLVENIIDLATNELIDDNGHCIWENHEVLNKAGFPIFCGERDRFGWLTGCIQTKKGIIVYG